MPPPVEVIKFHPGHGIIALYLLTTGDYGVREAIEQGYLIWMQRLFANSN